MAIPKREFADRAEAYRQACITLDHLAATMGARAIVTTYRIDKDGHPVDLAVIGGCCMEHVVKALSAGVIYVVDRCMKDEDDGDDCADEDYAEGATIN